MKMMPMVGKMKEQKGLGSKRKKKKTRCEDNSYEINPGADYPVHEKYTKEEPVKE